MSSKDKRDDLFYDAVWRNDFNGVRRALRDGAYINTVYWRDDGICRHRNLTPLLIACAMGHDEMVRLLLDAGAKTLAKTTRYSGDPTPVTIACEKGHLAIVQMLINHDSRLLDQEDNSERSDGLTPVMVASTGGYIEICRFLMDRGCDIHGTDGKGTTALMLAAEKGHVEVVRLLLDAGANVEVCDEEEEMTALHHSAVHGRIDAMRELILHGANICSVDHIGLTPFDLAFYDSQEEAADLLVEMYSSRLSQHEEGRLALHALLLIAEYSFEDCDDDNDELHVKIELGTLEWKHWRTLLLSVDEELLRQRDDSGKLPIHIACQAKAPVEVLTALVERDPATLHVADRAGCLALHECCCRFRDTKEWTSALRFFVDRGGVGTLAARNRDGALPLHVLCGASTTTSSQPLPLVQSLIQGFPGALSTRTNAGLYPFMIAASNSSLSSLCVLYEVVRANPVLVVPR